ncbi:MAG: hypothetical protein ACXVV5_29365, partial [Solirubrobacteraceae bacterium]
TCRVGSFQSSLISALATLMPDAEQDWGDDRRLSARAATAAGSRLERQSWCRRHRDRFGACSFPTFS